MDSQLIENKTVVACAWDAFNNGDLDVLDGVFDESYIKLTPYGRVDQGGPARVRQAYAWMHSVFGKIHFEIEQMLAEGDVVFSHVMATGQHIGEFMGVHATGKSVRFAAVVVSRIISGKHVQDWSFIDTMAILRQIGTFSIVPN